MKNFKTTPCKSHITYIVLSIYSIVYSLFPSILNIKILNHSKNFNGIFLLTKNKTIFNKKSTEIPLTIPIILKISIIFSIVLILAGIIFYLLKKFTFCAIFNFLSVFPSFLFFFALSEIRKTILAINIPLYSISINVMLPYFIGIILKILIGMMAILRKGKEKIFETIFFVCCIITLTIVLSIFIFIAIYGLPSFFKIGFFKFIFGSEWNPFFNKYGILNLLLGSIAATIGAIILTSPIGILAATFLSEIANKKFAYVFSTIVEILASIPSVIYGLFGMTTIVPLIKKIFYKTNSYFVVVGDSLLAAILVLSMMILPTILSTSYLALKNNPKSLKEASFNLGATKTQTIFKISLKNAKLGIFSGITLSIAKAFGETMAVIMVAGNVPNSINLLKPVRLLTTGIAIDISYSSGLLRQALFGIGLVLFILIILINLSFKEIFIKKFK